MPINDVWPTGIRTPVIYRTHLTQAHAAKKSRKKTESGAKVKSEAKTWAEADVADAGMCWAQSGMFYGKGETIWLYHRIAVGVGYDIWAHDNLPLECTRYSARTQLPASCFSLRMDFPPYGIITLLQDLSKLVIIRGSNWQRQNRKQNFYIWGQAMLWVTGHAWRRPRQVPSCSVRRFACPRILTLFHICRVRTQYSMGTEVTFTCMYEWWLLFRSEGTCVNPLALWLRVCLREKVR